MKKHFLLLLALAGAQLTVLAQTEQCATHTLLQQHTAQYPQYGLMVDQAFDQARQWVHDNGFSKAGGVYQIPVVVHVVYLTPQQNLADSIIHNQIAVLNRDYRRLNTDTINTRTEFLPLAADAEIEFYLATTDPDGNPTTGITRTAGTPALGSFSPFSDDVKYDSLGGKDAWPTNRYLNIWVCDVLFGFGVLGYAYPPIGNVPNWDTTVTPADPMRQGVVIHWTVFGSNNPNASGPYAITNRGRTATHEVGHYLGLRHVWGDGDCTMDDGLSDTPDADGNAGQVCDWSKNTCTESSGPELPDNIENYMDYAADSCMNMFTHGQVAMMRYVLETFRPELVGLPVGMPTYTLEENILLYPNPGTTVLNIRPAGTPADIRGGMMTDMAGRQVLTLQPGQTEINTSALTPGVYLVTIETTHGPVMQKWIRR